ncbi:type II toxin-antitoxin system RelE/ParE family toxin [Kineosporia mesophila]|nr:type II toxin-antitoxin system RelE/ParE family toxin [Kineosporia mesophila]MCD5354998.1 type II toxin-antitoxin system RelE/ParE family toxin [Kineosporia mesophila]
MPAARGELARASRAAALRILRSLIDLETDPYGFFSSGPVPFSSRPERRMLQVGDHRVVYTIERQHIVVWTVRTTGHTPEPEQ